MPNDLKREIERTPYGPLLPIEIKLVAWSLGLGGAALVLLAIIDRLHPAVS